LNITSDCALKLIQYQEVQDKNSTLNGFSSSEARSEDHGGGLSHISSGYIDPRLLSLVEAQVVIPIPTYEATLPVRNSVINFESSILPSGLDFSSEFQENDILSSVERAFNFSAQDSPFNTCFYDQIWGENEVGLPEVLSNFTFGSITHLSQTPPSLNDCFAHVTRSESLTSSSQSFGHTPPSSLSSIPSTNQPSLASSSQPLSAAGISCTWASCSKIFPTRASYK